KENKALPQIYAACARGLVMENLANAAGRDTRDRDQCFIVGAFSLLDKITGRPLAALFDDIALPEPIVAAVLEGRGPYAPHLALARSLEAGSAAPAKAADDLHLAPAVISTALLQALAATDALQSVV
ncbi:MAG TPA: histidine kinase, partial [Burkholderiaceae bacterium]|nr:histidine kinase [Burkholderiaceae bacterium]